ncbi:hypothetical protein M8J77_009965 [Diaphorina citri]|nr:hypothetical protein M8J77_009965 [Diaphorina citri]
MVTSRRQGNITVPNWMLIRTITSTTVLPYIDFDAESVTYTYPIFCHLLVTLGTGINHNPLPWLGTCQVILARDHQPPSVELHNNNPQSFHKRQKSKMNHGPNPVEVAKLLDLEVEDRRPMAIETFPKRKQCSVHRVITLGPNSDVINK